MRVTSVSNLSFPTELSALTLQPSEKFIAAFVFLRFYSRRTSWLAISSAGMILHHCLLQACVFIF